MFPCLQNLWTMILFGQLDEAHSLHLRFTKDIPPMLGLLQINIIQSFSSSFLLNFFFFCGSFLRFDERRTVVIISSTTSTSSRPDSRNIMLWFCKPENNIKGLHYVCLSAMKECYDWFAILYELSSKDNIKKPSTVAWMRVAVGVASVGAYSFAFQSSELAPLLFVRSDRCTTVVMLTVVSVGSGTISIESIFLDNMNSIPIGS